MLWLACSPESLAYQYLVCLVIAYRFSKPNAAVSETLFFYFWGEFHLKQTQNPRSLTHLIFICFFQTFTKNIYSPSSCIITFISIPLEFVEHRGGGGQFPVYMRETMPESWGNAGVFGRVHREIFTCH